MTNLEIAQQIANRIDTYSQEEIDAMMAIVCATTEIEMKWLFPVVSNMYLKLNRKATQMQDKVQPEPVAKQPTKLEKAKAIAKKNGIKGFRKLRLKQEMYIIGKQCQQMDKDTAFQMINKLEEIGYRIGGRDVCIQLAQKGMLDTITIEA